MKKVIEVPATKEEVDFYCDCCNQYIGTSSVYEDGWYRELGEVEWKVATPIGSFEYKENLCSECAVDTIENITTKVKALLEELGFEKV